jgi:L-alanine-DL-glutamate epimerase-like enolase superfamily enzyme
MELRVEERELTLRHPWTIARGTASSKRYAYVRLIQDGIEGWGEAAHNVRYGESLDGVREVLAQCEPLLARADPWKFQSVLGELSVICGPCKSALAALDLALWDWAGKAARLPVHRLLGLDPDALPLTSVSIGIDSPENVAKKIQEAHDHPILKIKLGGGNDEAIIEAVRSVTDKVIRVDANEGWANAETALAKCQWLAGQNVELIEQPLPAGRLDEMRWLRERSPLPLVADEDVLTARDVVPLAGAFDGINLKLMKAGGLLEAIRTIHVARAVGLKVMIGCMIESSLGITAAAQIGALADWLDLDGNLLIQADPFTGVTTTAGRLCLPAGNGLGVRGAQVGSAIPSGLDV